MSTATLSKSTVAGPTAPPSQHKVTFGHLLHSEWLKLWSVRSTIWTLGITVAVLVGMVLLFTLALVNVPEEAQMGEPTALDAFQVNVYLGPLAVAVLGALTITGEYTTGMIRSSLAAAPRRLPVLWSKGAVLAVVVFVTTLVSIALAALLQTAIFGRQIDTIHWSDTQTLRALTGYALYNAAISLLAFGLGAAPIRADEPKQG